MSKNFSVNTKMKAIEYIQCVNSIVAEFFYDDGEYVPHVGLMHAMKLFYDMCVESNALAEKITDDMSQLAIVDILAEDNEFVDAFNESCVVKNRCFDFANAYHDAMDIVNDRKSSANRVIEMIADVMNHAVDRIIPKLDKDLIEALKNVSMHTIDGKSAQYGVVKEFINSEFANMASLKER